VRATAIDDTGAVGEKAPTADGIRKGPRKGDGALVVRRLSKEYQRGVPVLKDISLDFPRRGVVAVIGPSGTGKSTLIRCINRLVEPTSGKIMLDGRDLTKLRGSALRAARREIGMIFQEYNLVERLSVIENLLCGRLGYLPVWRVWLRRFPETDIAEAFSLLDRVGLGDFATRRADALSGGQRQRVGIARAVMQNPKLLLADEPTSSLDPKTSVEIMELMRDLAAERDIPVIINIHDVALARRFATRIIGMSEGSVVYDGPPDELEETHLHQIYGAGDREGGWIG
jgi:phosphonate transport system ATP-binding protein